MTRKIPLAIGLVLMASGCMGTQSGHLYNMKTGQASSLSVLAAADSNGSIRGMLPDGAACEGEVSEISTDNARRVANVTPMLTENSRASVAVMNCGPNRVLSCTLARRESGLFSYGECEDRRGTPYSLIF
jgi:hypothetical protein